MPEPVWAWSSFRLHKSFLASQSISLLPMFHKQVSIWFSQKLHHPPLEVRSALSYCIQIFYILFFFVSIHFVLYNMHSKDCIQMSFRIIALFASWFLTSTLNSHKLRDVSFFASTLSISPFLVTPVSCIFASTCLSMPTADLQRTVCSSPVFLTCRTRVVAIGIYSCLLITHDQKRGHSGFHYYN